MTEVRSRARYVSLLSLAVLAGLAAFFLWFQRSSPALPVYQGKTLYEWISVLDKAFDSRPVDFRTGSAAQSAIRAIGTNALPFALADLKTRATPFDRLMGWMAQHAPYLKVHAGDVSQRWERGVLILDLLGPIGQPCLPELTARATDHPGYSEEAMLAVGAAAVPGFTNLLRTTRPPETQVLIRAFTEAVRTKRIKPVEATPALAGLVAVFHSKERLAAGAAAEAIGQIHQHPEICVPLLIDGSSNSSQEFARECIAALGEFGAAAAPYAEKIATMYDSTNAFVRGTVCQTLTRFRSKGAVVVPVLIRGLQDTNEDVRSMAALGLAEFTTLPEEEIQALEKALQDPATIVRWYSAGALGQFGPLATNAIPFLEQCRSDADPSVRSAAVNALGRIRQEAATRFVIPGPDGR